MQISLSGKKALVTGASKGIGKAIVKMLEDAGASVIGVSRSQGTDLLQREQREKLPKDINILVNCAGMQAPYKSALEFPIDVWDRELEINLTAMFDICQRVAPFMIENGWGRIINFTSIAGIQGTRGIIGYSVAKAGVIELTKCLSNEWSPMGVTVNCIAPGYVETEMLEPLISNPAATANIKGRIPIGRFGAPHEVASSVVYLCSDLANYITGVTLPVDGGWMAR
jgi:2-deoxy-D-gluconate 3-dehydrogenase